jgi:serine/threonine protein kinase
VREAQVAGETLREVMGRGPLDKVTAQRVAIDILDALVDCEHARIVHRDVKPENIAIDRRGACWLLDFDVALQVELAATTPGAAAAGWGTPGYAAPEQLTQSIGPVDARADLFGLGVTLHEACSGRHPLLAGARDVRDVVTRTLSMPVPRMCVRWDRAGAFADVVSAFTRIRREDRPPSAQDALEAMKRAVARRPGSLDA